MSYKIVFHVLGILLCCLSLTKILPIVVSLLYDDGQVFSFIISAFITFILGFSCTVVKKDENKGVSPKEGMLIVALLWIFLALFGAFPYFFSGVISFTDAVFESSSGFSTTGASIIQDIESLPPSLLFWRACTQWIGGMGIVVFSIAILPFLGTNVMQVFQAEVPGIVKDKVKPRLRDTALFLWKGYVLLSILCAGILYFLGMNIFDAITHSFTTISTGGFSTKNTSIMEFSSSIQWTLVVFMFLSGINFVLLFFAYTGVGIKKIFQDAEVRLYVSIIFLATCCIVSSFQFLPEALYSTFEENVRIVFFQVISIITTTGFATGNYEIWPPLAQSIILSIMFVGGCAGSTAGGMKVIRILILSKFSSISFLTKIHPQAVRVVKIKGVSLTEDIGQAVAQFSVLYMTIIMVGTLLITATNVDILTALTASITAVSNVGPGLGSIGPTENFAHFPSIAKWILSFMMLVGRLELYTVLVLLYPLFWKK
ncbi:MAG: TrkH family potassium uptake protein [Desulfovibrionaceae bacterium]